MWLLGIELRTSLEEQSVLLTTEPYLQPWLDLNIVGMPHFHGEAFQEPLVLAYQVLIWKEEGEPVILTRTMRHSSGSSCGFWDSPQRRKGPIDFLVKSKFDLSSKVSVQMIPGTTGRNFSL